MSAILPKTRKLPCLLAGCLLLAAPLAAGDREVLEEIVARVNNQIISLSDLGRSRQQLHKELADRYQGPELEQKIQESERDLLRDLIDQNLLVQRGTDLGVSVEADVIKRLEKMRQDMGLSSMEELERAAAAQGADLEEFKQQIRNQLLTQQVIQREVAGKVMVDAPDVRAYYLQHRQEMMRPESVHLREILVSTQGVASTDLPAREERVREVLGKIRVGEKFEEVARHYSDAPTAADGGELGLFETAKLAPALQDVVGKLREGGVSDPVRTPQGYLILQLVEHIPEGIPPFEKVEGEISQKLYYDKVTPALRDYLSGLRRENYVYVKRGYVDTGAVPELPRPVKRGHSRHPRRD